MANWIRAIVNHYFLGGRSHAKTAAFYKSQPENVILKSEDSQYTGAYIINKTMKPDEKTKFFVVCHGKGTDRHGATGHAKLKTRSNLNAIFLVIDVRGFGESTAEFSKEGANKDMDAAFTELRKHYNAKEISLIGHSYGAAISLAYANYVIGKKDKLQPSKIFLFAPFENLSPLLNNVGILKFLFHIPGLESFLFKDLEYENGEAIKKVQNKVVIFHGTRDETIPHDHSKRMASESKGVKVYINDDTHDGAFGNEENWKKLFELAGVGTRG